ncbi:CheY-like superfamily [Lentinula boryana]|uniref:CheY-like superfamily n=1 Tax=Lentinula boryana TaxID=40481 RepID=A0ABQ8PYW6_9AGAR|nr:CheY-like superfamily [Lentinula boryana]
MCPDLLITDVMMPGLNGLDLLQELAKDPNPDIQNLPIILLTASSSSEGKIDHKPDRFLQRPIDYLLKPFSSVELVRRIQTRLHTVRQKLELDRQV